MARSTKSTNLTAFSFFSGALGLDLGLEKAGIDVVLASEIDKRCRETIQLNRPDLPLLGDINDYTGKMILEASGFRKGFKPDIMVGGPPCQAFSTAGKRQGFKDTRGNVFLKYIDLILEIQPRYAVIENVRGLLSAPLSHRPHSLRSNDDAPLKKDELPGGALRYILRTLRNAGYGVSFNLYNSANFGSPQIRERVIMICSKNGEELPFLKPTHAEDGKHKLKPWLTFRDAVKNLKDKNPEYIPFPEKRLKYYRLLKDGQYWKHLPEKLQREALGNAYESGGGKTGFLRRIAWDRPSPTLVTDPTMPATDLAHPELLRPLSVKEYARLQEFPDSWQFCGNTKDKYKQIGNAVPASLGEALGKCLIEHASGVRRELDFDFQFSRYKNTDHNSWLKTNL
jgi:DNA (cytosine-5)-methyltransferase 1